MIAPFSIMGFLSVVFTAFAAAVGWRLGTWIMGKILGPPRSG